MANTTINLPVWVLLLIWAQGLGAQPKPCTDPQMTSRCADACVVCDINGFTGINDSQIQGQAPPGFCTTQVHHMQWIAFIAGSTSLTLSIDVFNCQANDGLEIGIYQSLNCQTFKLVSNCDTDVDNNTTGIIRTTTPLVVGQYYYLVMDGSNDDVCNYTVRVTSGTTMVPPLGTSGTIRGESPACLGKAFKYGLSFPKGATAFQWVLDGVPIGRDSTVSINWNTPGDHQLCAIASNACDTAAPTCRIIRVEDNIPVAATATICRGTCLNLPDTTLCWPGKYRLKYRKRNGCDSLVDLSLAYAPPVVRNLSAAMCETDSIVVGNKIYRQAGQYTDTLRTPTGCDSIIHLSVKIIFCNIKTLWSVQNADCQDSPSGSLRFQVTSATPPLQYFWQKIGTPNITGNGLIEQLNTPIQLTQLLPGDYAITISDLYGNETIVSAEVVAPPPLTVGINPTLYRGYGVTCPGHSDGVLNAQVFGGTPPYYYRWDNGATAAHHVQRPAGIHTLTVSDAKGCTAQASIVLQEPPPLVLAALFSDPDCSGFGGGKIEAIATGGVPPYDYALASNTQNTSGLFQHLPPATYTIAVTDANGCTTDTVGQLIQPLIPVISLGPDRTLDLGDELLIDWPHPAYLTAFTWTPADVLSCFDCAEPVARPFRTVELILSATANSGCMRSDSIVINVLERRRVYVPNVFQPNDQGRNDLFFVSGGSEVSAVKSLRVYSRWGELVYETREVPPNEPSYGWDGRFKGHLAEAGVYVWIAEIRFLDGVSSQYQGDVSLLR